MNINELKKRIADAGCVGAGGAGFPTAVKVAEGADSLIINAAECEPLLYTDYYVMKRAMERIASGAETVMEAAGIPNGYLGVKAHTAKRLGLSHGDAVSSHVKVHILPDVYPMGDEIILIYQVLGRVVTPGSLPLSAGVLVFNAETLYNVDRAVKEGLPVTEKWVTIGGKVARPVSLKVPVGTGVAELFAHLGVSVPEGCVVIDGGPAMGPVINPDTAVITKTTKGLLILPDDIPAITSKLSQNRAVMVHASSNCCQCTLCSEMCPRALIGYPLRPHKIVRTSLSLVEEMPEAFTEAQVCSACGVCELTACCQGISPRRVYAQVKGILAKNKLRYQHKGELTVDPDREYRMLPSDRFMTRIGVAPFDAVPDFLPDSYVPSRVTLPMRQHVGAPAAPAVKAGDTVRAGDIVGAAAGVVSANIHAPVSGRVASADAGTVVIVTA